MMIRYPFRISRMSLSLRVLLGVVALLVVAAEASAVLGVRRRTAAVAYTAGASNSAAAAQQSAAAQQQTEAAQSAAAASEAAAASAEAASQAAAATQAAAAPKKTSQQKLEELQSLYKQGLISESEFNASKAKILAEMQ